MTTPPAIRTAKSNGGARSEFIAAVVRLAAEVRQGRSPSQCWAEVEAALRRLEQRRPQSQHKRGPT